MKKKKNNPKCDICGIDIHKSNLTFENNKPCHIMCLNASNKASKDVKDNKKSVLKELVKNKFHIHILITGALILLTMICAIIGFIFGFNLGQQVVKFLGG